jgi:hypothetical protein
VSKSKYQRGITLFNVILTLRMWHHCERVVISNIIWKFDEEILRNGKVIANIKFSWRTDKAIHMYHFSSKGRQEMRNYRKKFIHSYEPCLCTWALFRKCVNFHATAICINWEISNLPKPFNHLDLLFVTATAMTSQLKNIQSSEIGEPFLRYNIDNHRIAVLIIK